MTPADLRALARVLGALLPWRSLPARHSTAGSCLLADYQRR